MTRIAQRPLRRALLLAGASAMLPGCSWWRPALPAAPQANLGDLGLQLLRAQPAGNAIVAPYNVAAGLDLLRSGAAGATAQQIGALAGLPDRSVQFNAGASWQAAQRLWLAPAATPRPEFLAAARVRGADAVSLDGGEAAINAWAAEHTAGKVRTLLAPGSLAPATQMVLTSTAHFKAAWRQPFPANRTVLAPFHHAGGGTAQVPTMIASLMVRSGQAGRYRLLELPYAASGLALLIAMPDGAPANPLDGALDGEQLSDWRRALHPAQFELHLPRFAVSARSASIKAALQRAGMTDAFSAAADFSPMSGQRDLVLGDMVQAAAIEVNESGTEAVAAGAATMVLKSLPAPDAEVLRIDRPFLFALVHADSGTLLFLGAVYQLGGEACAAGC